MLLVKLSRFSNARQDSKTKPAKPSPCPQHPYVVCTASELGLLADGGLDRCFLCIVQKVGFRLKPTGPRALDGLVQ